MNRFARRAAVVLLVVLGGVGLLAAAGGLSEREPDSVLRAGPHGTSASSAELAGTLNAAESVASSASPATLVAEGRKLFRSSSAALDGESCQSCHTDGGANGPLGTIVHPQKTGDFIGPRDPPALWGLARTAPYRWQGDVPTLDAMVADTVRSHFKSTVTNTNDPATVGRLTASLVAYLEQLEPPRTAWDDGTLTAKQLRGEKLFQGKAGCIACHTGVLFTDTRIHDTGVAQAPGANDPGAPAPLDAEGRPISPGPFIDTPQLRDLGSSAPYMHNGVEKTLVDVVRFYSERSRVSPLRLTEAEIGDLVAFLEGL